MRILVLGASGAIGSVIYRHLSARYEAYGTFNKNKPTETDAQKMFPLDISADLNADNGLACLLERVRPDIIISSLTGAFEPLLTSHQYIADYVLKTNGRSLFLSSDNIFDGAPDRYPCERDVPFPVSAYGKNKYACERLLQNQLGNQCLIIRLPRTLSPVSASAMVRRLDRAPKVYDNLILSYNTAENVARATGYCIETDKRGVVHLSSRDALSDADFAKALLARRGRTLASPVESLTAQAYGSLLSWDDPSVLRLSGGDQNFYLTLTSMDTDISEKFGISCDEVVASVVADGGII